MLKRCTSLIGSILAPNTECDSLVTIPTIGRVQITKDVIGAGAFSLVLVGSALDLKFGSKVAVKIGMTERAGIEEDSWILSKLNGTTHSPNYFGTTEVRCTKSNHIFKRPILVMEWLGEPLDVFARNIAVESESYRIRRALEVGQGVLDAIEVIHTELGIIMHDIYARNIVLGRNEAPSIPRLIDFGESLRIEKNGNSEYHQLNSLYTSIREDQKAPLGPRDDLERILYLMIYIARGGSMPWHSFEGNNVLLAKSRVDPSTVGVSFPGEVFQLLIYARSGITDAGELPDYMFVRRLLEAALARIPL